MQSAYSEPYLKRLKEVTDANATTRTKLQADITAAFVEKESHEERPSREHSLKHLLALREYNAFIMGVLSGLKKDALNFQDLDAAKDLHDSLQVVTTLGEEIDRQIAGINDCFDAADKIENDLPGKKS